MDRKNIKPVRSRRWGCTLQSTGANKETRCTMYNVHVEPARRLTVLAFREERCRRRCIFFSFLPLSLLPFLSSFIPPPFIPCLCLCLSLSCSLSPTHALSQARVFSSTRACSFQTSLSLSQYVSYLYGRAIIETGLRFAPGIFRPTGRTLLFAIRRGRIGSHPCLRE